MVQKARFEGYNILCGYPGTYLSITNNDKVWCPGTLEYTSIPYYSKQTLTP